MFTALYSGLLELDDCDECQGGRLCQIPRGIDEDGYEVDRGDGEGLYVSWPGCPGRWRKRRALGQDVVSLPTILQWAIERGEHRREHVPARWAKLMRLYLAHKDAPGVLELRRNAKQNELEARAKDAGRP